MTTITAQSTQEEIIAAGRVKATAKIQLDGYVLVIAVYDTSTYYKFFHCFTAKTMRTPQKNWKRLPGQYNMIYGNRPMGKDPEPYFTLEQFAEFKTHRMNPGRTVVKYLCKKKDMEAFRERIIHPPQQAAPEGATFGVASKITSGQQSTIRKQDRAAAWQSWKNLYGKGR